MERLDLIHELKKLSTLVKERRTYDDQLHQLEYQRKEILKTKDDVQVVQDSAEAKENLLRSVQNRADDVIRATKVWIWVVSLLAILASGALTAVCLLADKTAFSSNSTQFPPLGFLLAVPIALCISAFCFYKIKEDDFGCLGTIICWCFGIGCGLECIVFLFMLATTAGVSGIIFSCCFVAGVLASVLITTLNGWQDRLIAKYKNKAMASQAYQEAVNADNATLAQNEQRRRNAIAQKNQFVQGQVDAIDSQLNKLQQLRDNVDAKLIESRNIYPYRDLGMIDKVIDKLEGMRANTLQEALLQCDADSREEFKELREQWQREEEKWERKMAQQQYESKILQEQQRHNHAVEYEQKRQADELESIRRKLEDY